jgi:hypothetical protein
VTRTFVLAAVLASAPAFAQAPAVPPVQTVPAPPAPGAGPSRTFTAPVGMLLNTVRPDKVADFERVVALVRAAMEKSTDTKDRQQAQSWKVYKAAEPGPGGSVLYVFVFDPTLPNTEYGFNRILADAYPDTAQLQEIWKLYTGSLTGGGSLLNLTPVTGAPASASPATPTPAAPAERPLPPDADPNKR